LSERLTALRNLTISSTATYVENATGLLASVLIARSLGPIGYADYAFAIWLSGWLIRACNHALTTISIRFIAEARGAGDEARAQALLNFLLRMQAVSSAIVLGLFALSCALAAPDGWSNNPVLIPLLILVSVYARAAFWMGGAVGKGYERFEVESASLVVMATINVLLTIAWSLTSDNWIGYLAIYAISSLILLITSRYVSNRVGITPKAGIIPDEVLIRLKDQAGLTALLTLVGLAGGRTIETAILKTSSSPSDFAFFVIAGTLTRGAIDFVASGLASVLLPAMSRAYGGKGTAGTSHIAGEAIRYYWFLGLVIACMAILVGPGAVAALYGVSYLPAVPAVVASLITAGLFTHIGALTALQTAAERQRDRLAITVMTILFNGLTAWALIPRYGLNGAIASVSVTGLFQVALTWWIVLRHTKIKVPISIMTRMTGSGAGASLTAYFLVGNLPWDWSFLLSGAAFTVIFPALCIVFRCLRSADFDMISTLLLRFKMLRSSIFVLSIKQRFSA